jgi:hypothetical protein
MIEPGNLALAPLLPLREPVIHRRLVVALEARPGRPPTGNRDLELVRFDDPVGAEDHRLGVGAGIRVRLCARDQGRVLPPC